MKHFKTMVEYHSCVVLYGFSIVIGLITKYYLVFYTDHSCLDIIIVVVDVYYYLKLLLIMVPRHRSIIDTTHNCLETLLLIDT